jgi:hypothetical protein
VRAPGAVLVAQREPAIAAAAQRPDAVEGLEPAEQAVAVDASCHRVRPPQFQIDTGRIGEIAHPTLPVTPTLDDIAPARDRVGAIVEERPYPGGVAQVGMGKQPKLALEVW